MSSQRDNYGEFEVKSENLNLEKDPYSMIQILFSFNFLNLCFLYHYCYIFQLLLVK